MNVVGVSRRTHHRCSVRVRVGHRNRDILILFGRHLLIVVAWTAVIVVVVVYRLTAATAVRRRLLHELCGRLDYSFVHHTTATA